ncbi:MAG: arylsulfatase [Akkermansiaceae bacterium]|nr:arylsulfatase [Akkermansiaceae bacterium]
MLRLAPFLCLLAFPISLASAAPRPNIILIMSDDIGYSDIGCYGSEIETPVLDKLAANGLRYTHFYNTGRCCPTRASLLTGLYAHQAGIGQMTNDGGQPGYRGDLSRNAVTIAEALKPAGYRSYMSGKWHVTKQLQPDGDKSNWPLQRGFDRFYGTIIGAGSLFDPWTLTKGNQAITPVNDPEYQPEEWYYTDAISDYASRFVREHAEDHAGQPFFLYVAYTAAHWPMHALEKDIAKYKGRYDAGYEAIRQTRYQKMKELGVIEDHWALSPGAQKWEGIEEDKRAWELRCMEVYAAMVDSMDQGIGRIVKSLEETGQLENTLILYLQDNGGCAENLGRKSKIPSWAGGEIKPGEVRPMKPDELQTHMVPRCTRDGKRMRVGPGVMPGPADTYIAYGRNWANVSNTPFREYKADNHEGGIATPLIAHWPKGITAKGALRHEPGHLIDLMATCVELSGGDYPESHAGHDILPMEGRSLVGGFAADRDEERMLIFEHFGKAAIHKGKWKLVRLGEKRPWELYNIEVDRTELNDLSKERPELAAQLEQLWEKEAERTLIYPKPKGKRKQ